MINLSSKCLYGLAAIFELAIPSKQTSLPIRQIAKAQSIPEDYLRQLLVTLKKAGLIKSMRGKAGGYALARPAAEITVREIIEKLDGPLELPRTILKDRTLKSYLADRQKIIESAFDQTLEELIAERMRQAECIVYHI